MTNPRRWKLAILTGAVSLTCTLVSMGEVPSSLGENTFSGRVPAELVGTWQTSSSIEYGMTRSTGMASSYTFRRDGTYEYIGYVEPGQVVSVQSLVKESGTISVQGSRLIFNKQKAILETYDSNNRLVDRTERREPGTEAHRWRVETSRLGRTLWLDDLSYNEKR